MVKALVKAGANKEMKDNNGNTPEDTAKNRGLTQILDFLKSDKKI
jgi:ankyrin repeat protein